VMWCRMAFVAHALGVPRRHSCRRVVGVFITPGTGVETSLDAARMSAYATWLPEFATHYTRS
jgi:hypothetical protein